MANFRVGTTGNFAAGGRLGFGVGITSFLESEQSKIAAYWRAIEYGLAVEDFGNGGVFFGVFGAGSRYAARGTAFYGPMAEFGGGTGQMQFFPLGYAASLLGGTGTPTAIVLRHLRATGHATTAGGQAMANQRGGNVVMHVKHPIVAQEAYTEAWKSFDAPQREKEAVEQVMGKLMFTTGGFTAGRNGVVRGAQKKVRFVDQMSGSSVVSKASHAAFRGRSGLLAGGASSARVRSLAGLDRTFQANMVEINRVLAEGLAAEVARIQKEKIKRKGTSTGKLVAATLNPENRFPR